MYCTIVRSDLGGRTADARYDVHAVGACAGRCDTAESRCVAQQGWYGGRDTVPFCHHRPESRLHRSSTDSTVL